MDALLPWAQAITTGGGVLVMAWVVKQLTDEKGVLSPRWSRDQERQARMDSEHRTDRTLDLFEAFMDAAERKGKGGA